MGGLTFEKLLIVGVIALIIVGPERLPRLAEGAAGLIRRLRGWTDQAKSRVQEELGEDFTEEDWRRLDPRQYDPRRIIRDAWNDAGEGSAAAAGASAATAPSAAGAAVPGTAARQSAPDWATGPAGPVPFDDEAT